MPMRALSSHRRRSLAWCTIRPRRPHAGHRQPFLYGVTATCNSCSRSLSQVLVTFKFFRRRIWLSNFMLLTGFSSFVSTQFSTRNEARVSV